MTVATYAGVVVRDLARSVGWYCDQLGCDPVEDGDGWTCLRFADGSRIELFAGDPARPGTAFPSYGTDGGPPVLPGLGLREPGDAAEGLRVVRRLPGWFVVVAPAGVRVVLTDEDGEARAGLVGFRWRTPAVAELRRFLAGLGCDDEVEHADIPAVVPLIAGSGPEVLVDPDGTAVERVVR